MERHVLSKSTFIRGTQCLKSLYLNKNRPFLRDRLPDSQRAIFKRGTDVGVLVQQLFPHGIDLSPKSPSQFGKRVSETAEIIRTNSFTSLYEALFQYDKLLAILDILVKGQQSWIAYEVKSSTKASETYLMDAAFQYYVITNSGVELEDFFLVYINKDYVFDGELDLQKLFIKQSVLNEVVERQKFIAEKANEEKEILLRPSSPEIYIGSWCHDPYPCDFLGHCWRQVQENSVLYLDAFEKDEGFLRYYSGKDNPEEFESGALSEKQEVQLWSARNKKVFVDEKKLMQLADNIADNSIIFSPYLIKMAVPYLANTHPYQPIPIACAVQTLDGIANISFFINENNPIELFISNFRNLIENYSKLIIYDKKYFLNFLLETGGHELVEEADGKLVELSEVFHADMLFDYRIRWDYSPQNVAWIFLKQRIPLLDPSLLNMNWQKGLMTGKLEDELIESTRKYLGYYVEFQYDFINFLKNPKSMISF